MKRLGACRVIGFEPILILEGRGSQDFRVYGMGLGAKVAS